ncbi:histidine kinase [Rhodococcus sp. NPDC060086]|uniref:histidine kinase n=1 Tax=Rhodococcus sp. NPDC060086 TaxID=3347055 RepID=UPI0036523820
MEPASHFGEDSWSRFHRWSPPVLLALGIVLCVGTASMVMRPAEWIPVSVLTVVAAALEVWWWRTGPGTGAVYYILRTVIAFALSWFNPFFAIYALVGYFDAPWLITERWARLGLLATAVTMAGSQSGGLPPSDSMQWTVFGLLFVLNAVISMVMYRIGERDLRRTEERIEAIAELERMNTRLEQALSENRALHAQLVQHAREAGIDDERRRLAAEIHDTLAQSLTGIITQLQAAGDAEDPDAARRHVTVAADLARRSLGDARRSVQNLAPEALEHDTLESVLAESVDRWSVEHGIWTDFTVTGDAEPLHDDIAVTLLRITQEALANVAKHASAHRVGVTVSYMGDEVSVDIRDDGLGFDPAAVSADGFGMKGMRSRVARVAGVMDVESEIGAGTAVSVRVPQVRAGSVS